MNCSECQDLFCKHRSQSTAGGQCFYESKEQMEKLLAVTTEATFAYVDWAAFRREAAKEMLPIVAQMKLAKEGAVLRIVSKETAAKLAIEYADELIKQLKEEKA